MSRRLLRLLLALMMLANNVSTFASFESQDAGARAPGMADSFTAIADDADSIVYNPAGLVQLQEGQITSQYGQLVKGLDDGSTLGTTYLGYAHPLIAGYRTIGFGYHNFRADNLFNERTLILSYGQRVDAQFGGLRGIYSIGGNFKQLHRQYEPDRFTENALNDAGVASNQRDQLFSSGNAKDTYAVDLGGLVQFGAKYQYTAGLALINVNQPDVSLGGDGDKAPLAIKAGLAYRPRWGTLTAESRQVERLVNQRDQDLAFGVERNFPFAALGALIMRGGYASGSRGYKALTTGMSYIYSRFRLDYAFSFPVGNFADTSGSHRIGFAFKLGAGSSQLTKDYSNSNLLSAFEFDSLTTHVLLSRLSSGRSFTPDYKDHLMLVLVRKYPLDDAGLKDVRTDLRSLMRKYSESGLDWARLKFLLLKGVPDEDKSNSLEALEALVKNQPKAALMRLAVLPIPVQKGDRISAISAMALGELAAQSYRRQELDPCIDYVRRIVEIMPSDEVVLRAYRELLARRAKISERFNKQESETIRVEEALPEAPQDLVAPTLQQETPAMTLEQEATSKSDEMMKAFGAALGYYMVRKSAGAPVDELIALLNQMRAVYGASGIDMSIVNFELAALRKTKPAMPKTEPAAEPAPVATPAPEPAQQPAVETPAQPEPAVTPVKPVAVKKPAVEKPVNVMKPAPVEKPVPVEKPAPATETATAAGAPANPALERAWTYYKDAASRDISDHEKIELLQDMLRRFGEQGAGRINKELERIRRRLDR